MPWKKYIVRLINFFLHFQFSLLATFAMIIMLNDHNDIGCHRVIFMIFISFAKNAMVKPKNILAAIFQLLSDHHSSSSPSVSRNSIQPLCPVSCGQTTRTLLSWHTTPESLCWTICTAGLFYLIEGDSFFMMIVFRATWQSAGSGTSL